MYRTGTIFDEKFKTYIYRKQYAQVTYKVCVRWTVNGQRSSVNDYSEVHRQPSTMRYCLCSRGGTWMLATTTVVGGWVLWAMSPRSRSFSCSSSTNVRLGLHCLMCIGASSMVMEWVFTVHEIREMESESDTKLQHFLIAVAVPSEVVSKHDKMPDSRNIWILKVISTLTTMNLCQPRQYVFLFNDSVGKLEGENCSCEDRSTRMLGPLHISNEKI